MKRYILTILVATMVAAQALAQEYITISGRVVNEHGEKMGQVNIRAVGSTIATVTNGEGEFTIKIPSESNIDSLRLSHVGYKISTMACGDISDRRSITLSSAPITLETLNISLEDASSLLVEAFKRVPYNYPTQRTLQTAYYREMIKKGSSYATLTEAVVEVDRGSYSPSSPDRTAIFKGRSSRDNRFTDSLFVKFQGGITTALDIDIVKNQGVLFTDRPSDEYKVYRDVPTTIDGRATEVVSFNQISKATDVILFRGQVFIDSISRAIVRAEFNLNVEGRDNATSIFIKKSPPKAKMEVTEAKYIIAYRLIEDKWHFDYSNTELRFKCKWQGRLFSNNYTISSELAITEHGSEPRRIPHSERVKSRDIAYESAQGFYDPLFWEDYNTIEPEADISSIIKRIVKQLEKEQK